MEGYGVNGYGNSCIPGNLGCVGGFLLIYIVKSNEKRDAKQEEREKNYQTVIESLTEKFQILTQVQSDLKELKNNLLGKNEQSD